ncbi:dihydrofolate reductase family protein [Nocardia alni]|uniref:dihydrofolate reductase family protein n=1 Tax=Nocardia alni TaxID=2815723 RepID=UPI001C2191D2|nr:dihydrofolate reductase family protein [Nocardia alni]
MGKIVVTENISLDGVFQDPTGSEGIRPSDWRAELTPADRVAWNQLILEDVLSAEALLLGRSSYEFFAASYPSRTGPMADRMNGLPKYIVSTTRTDLDWNNSTVLKGEAPQQIAKLKETVEGDIRVYASSRLVHTLIDHDLVDELRLIVFPILVAAGARLFSPAATDKPLHRTDIRAVGDSLALLTYQFAGQGGASVR